MMKRWVRKTLVLLFTIVTFGLVSPPDILLADENTSGPSSQESTSTVAIFSDPYHDESNFMETFIAKAEKQSFEKFGNRIGPVIEDEFKSIIFPKMEEVIKHFLKVEKENFEHVMISSKPSGGKSEKIFHIYDEKTGNDLIRFHVRVDHPPQEGYWFNFHYHTYHDHFQTHYHLGKIYWDRNTPPNWMTH